MDTDFELTLKQIEQVVHEINALGEGDIDAYPEDEEDDFDDGTDLDIGDGNGEDQDDKLQG